MIDRLRAPSHRVRRRPFRMSGWTAALLLFATGVAYGQAADQRIDRKMAVDPDASIRIYNMTGSVRVEAWNRDTFAISGSHSGDAGQRFYIGGTRRGAKIGLETPPDVDQAPAHLYIRVPPRARVWIKSASASVVVSGLNGGIDVFSTSGGIRFEGAPDQLNMETMDGNIEVNAGGTWIRAKTASGTITLRGSGEDVGATTVSGGITLLSAGMRRVRMETVSGDIAFSGPLTRDGALTAESHSGTVDLLLPANIGAEFDFSTYHGLIRNELHPARVPRQQGSGQELHFTAADGGANVTVRTFKGTIVLRKK